LLFTGARGGFNVMFTSVPEALDDLVDMVIPELQRRGLFREEYEGQTFAGKSRIAETCQPVLT
jgi:N-acetyl-S-(2-succino)cysteine monooxygenase